MMQNIEPSEDRPWTLLEKENMFIGISGLIGAGKTTLATELGKVMGLPVYYEPVIDNVYLSDFYKDPKKYSFNLQIYLLNVRFKQHQQIIWNAKGGVQDRTIYEDSVFAKVLRDSELMEERDYRTYISLFTNMSNFMKKNTLIVHLDVTPEESLERIKLRSRDMETTITIDYLRSLHSAYDSFLKDISKQIPVIRVNYSQFKTAEQMARVVYEEYSKLNITTFIN
ncbi:deoxyadenosine/deoxycytidine kinase DCK [Acrasis kona]|uniref:Deoxyadenosine/deoxycytidine kinase DCK n=1 Tax=Acrasis kona TaxID=1008807 RepID=A0AAW2ZII1_9EUKA